jgi:hypothetical protein
LLSISIVYIGTEQDIFKMADFESQLSNKGKGKSRFRAKPSRENNPNDTPGLCFFLSKLAAINCVPEFTVPLLALCFVLPAKNISHQKFGIKKTNSDDQYL